MRVPGAAFRSVGSRVAWGNERVLLVFGFCFFAMGAPFSCSGSHHLMRTLEDGARGTHGSVEKVKFPYSAR